MSSKSSFRAAGLGGTADELEAAFYDALQRGDIDALMACWSDDDEVFCVHAGGVRITGVQAVRASFEALFSNMPIRATPMHVRKVEKLACAVHSVLERIEVLSPEGPRQVYVFATNVYDKTARGWRMVAHHASPASAAAPQEVGAAPSVLH